MAASELSARVGAGTTLGRVVWFIAEAAASPADVRRVADTFSNHDLPAVPTSVALARFLGHGSLATARGGPPFDRPAAKRPLTYVRHGHIIAAMETTTSVTPLTPAVFHILLALASGERHGYEMMKQVRQDSQGRVAMGSGTLYGSIKRMVAAGLIEEAGERPDPACDDERRRYYRLTEPGRRALLAELRRYDQVVSLAHRRRLIPDPQPEGSR